MTPPGPPGVALVYPYFRSRDPVEKLFPPLGIACLAAQLRERGVPVTVVDCTFETFAAAVDAIADARPAVVGISVMVTMSRNAFDLLAALRDRLPAALFVAGGPLPTVLPGMFAQKFDLVFRGEGDVTFPDFCRAYLEAGRGRAFLGGLRDREYPGVYAEVDGRVLATPPVHHPASVLDRLPLPDRSDFDHRRYGDAMEQGTGLRQTSLIVTRGCPFDCDFCSKPVWGSLLRKPPLERVFQEIDAIRTLGYTSLWIADDCFTLDTDYLVAFCRGMIRRGAPVGWTCLSRVERVTPGLVDLMKRAGCLRVYLGLESGSDATLRLMNKRVTVGQGARAVEIFAAAGVGTAGFFMVGYPGETVEDVEATFAHALSLPLDEISFTVPLPLPGTPLYDRVADPAAWEDWEVSNEVKFVYPTAFDEAWLARRIAETMAAFAEKKQGGAPPRPERPQRHRCETPRRVLTSGRERGDGNGDSMDPIKIPKVPKEEYDALIRRQYVSRIAFGACDEHPYVAPFVYVFDDRYLYFLSTKYGRKMEFFETDPRVSVEIEEYAPDLSSFTFVSLQGRLEEVADPGQRRAVRERFLGLMRDRGLSPRLLSAFGHDPSGPPEAILSEERSMVWRLADVSDIVALRNG